MDWGYILATVIVLAFVLIGGKYWKLKKEITEFVDAIKQAIEDGSVDDIEIARIIKEGKDIGRTLREITWSVITLLNRR